VCGSAAVAVIFLDLWLLPWHSTVDGVLVQRQAAQPGCASVMMLTLQGQQELCCLADTVLTTCVCGSYKQTCVTE
jgi:hypothetical protein